MVADSAASESLEMSRHFSGVSEPAEATWIEAHFSETDCQLTTCTGRVVLTG